MPVPTSHLLGNRPIGLHVIQRAVLRRTVKTINMSPACLKLNMFGGGLWFHVILCWNSHQCKVFVCCCSFYHVSVQCVYGTERDCFLSVASAFSTVEV